MKLTARSIKLSYRRALGTGVLAAALLLGLAAPAHAERALITKEVVQAPKGGIEGACGIAFRSGLFYVSDYYHHAIDVFEPAGLGQPYEFKFQLPFDPLDGPCQLASSPSGALYANDWHENVTRVLPSVLEFDSGESTGVAVDQTTAKVYVNDRTYVAVYEPSGAPVLSEGQPLRIGQGSLGDGYGLAVFAGRVYVADASDRTVKVYEPAVDTVNPVLVIDGEETPQSGFNSLVDAAVAIDPTNGHLLVLDNLQPGFEHPQAALDEFDAAGAFLGQLSEKLIDGEPSGLAFDGATLYATNGNSEGAQVFAFGAYAEGGPGLSEAQPSAEAPLGQTAVAPAATRSEVKAALASGQGEAVVIQRGGVRVSFDGKLAPRRLPRHKAAPVRVVVATKISSINGDPPQLRALSLAINRYGRFDTEGLPVCPERQIQPATNANALAACSNSLVGQGHFSAKVRLTQQAPFPAEGKVYAFNGRLHGHPAILAHVYGTKPVPTSFTLPFELRPAKGTYGTVLRAVLPHVTGDSGYITGLSMNLGRNFTYKGRHRSYLSASCPAPKGTTQAPFPLAHAGFDFKGGRSLGSTLVRSCAVRN